MRRGEKSTRICFYKTLNKEETNDEGEAKTRKVFFLRSYVVFNLDQVSSTQEGDRDRLAKFHPVPDDEAIPVSFTDWQPAEELCESTGASIRHIGGNRACYYRPTPIDSWLNQSGGDYIQLPMRYQFADYYGTKLHELIHWTEIRRGWDGSYAMDELIAEIGDRPGEVRALINLGRTYEAQGRLETAEKCQQQSLAMRREIGFRHGEGGALECLSIVYNRQDRLHDAEPFCQQSLRIYREFDHHWGESESLYQLGRIYRIQGRLEEAERCFKQSLEFSRELGGRVKQGNALENIAKLRNAQGDVPRALEFAREPIHSHR